MNNWSSSSDYSYTSSDGSSSYSRSTSYTSDYSDHDVPSFSEQDSRGDSGGCTSSEDTAMDVDHPISQNNSDDIGDTTESNTESSIGGRTRNSSIFSSSSNSIINSSSSDSRNYYTSYTSESCSSSYSTSESENLFRTPPSHISSSSSSPSGNTRETGVCSNSNRMNSEADRHQSAPAGSTSGMDLPRTRRYKIDEPD